MRTAYLSAFATVIGLHALKVHGKATCHVDNPIVTGPIFDLNKIRDVLSGPVSDLCSKDIQTGNSEAIAYSTGDITFQVIQTGTHSAKECKDAFENIISECIGSQNVGGGKLAGVNGTVYDIYHRSLEESDWEARNEEDLKLRDIDQGFEDMHSSLDKRTPKGGRAKPKAPKPTTPKPKTPKPKAPKPKAPKPKTPKPKTPKPKTPKPKTTKTPKASKTASAPKIGPTKTCKQLYAQALASSKKAANANLKRREEAISHGFIGSRLHIEKRTPKSTLACGTTLHALDYPNHNQMPAVAKFYGFTQPDVCDVFGFSGAAKPPKGQDVNNDYEVEHVLEWQVVSYFFDWVEAKSPGPIFDNPAVTSTKLVKFCQNWKETWLGANQKAFEIDGKTRTVAEHLKHAYPGIEHKDQGGKNVFIDEFVWLSKVINAPAKTSMWAYRNGKEGGIFADNTLEKLIVGKSKGRGKNKKFTAANINDAKEALNRLRYIMGARKYMRTPAIAKILKTQKERMGDMIGKIDVELPKHPREKSTGKLPAWKSHNLKKLWDQYMDERFRIANQRTNHDLDTYLPLLLKEWKATVPVGPSDTRERKELYALIQKVEKEWKTEKRIAWVKPW